MGFRAGATNPMKPGTSLSEMQNPIVEGLKQ